MEHAIASTRMTTSSRSLSASSHSFSETAITTKHRTAAKQQAMDAHTLPSTKTADALVQAEVADLSSGSHLLRHSPRQPSLWIHIHGQSSRCTSGTFSTKFPDPHDSPISLERPISVNISAEIRTISVGNYFPTEIDYGILSLQTP